MNQKGNKPKKQKPWNEYAYLASLARKKEPVTIYLNRNTIEDESVIKGIIVDCDNYSLAFLAEGGRELLIFKHAIRFIERLKGKPSS